MTRNISAPNDHNAIPGTTEECSVGARVACLRALSRGVMLGLEFLDDGGIEPYRARLETFVEDRINQISQWNSSAERKSA